MRPVHALLLLPCLVAPDIGAQSPVADARAALEAGKAWRATQIITPVVANGVTRTPEAVLVAARAAAQWEGWATVRSLLEREPWLDTQFDRLGRRLLAEAALGSNRNADALLEAARAVQGGAARDSVEQALRLVLLARALDRGEQRDSAAVVYRHAASQLPVAAEWLALRAAGVTADSSARAKLYAQVRTPVAAARIPWTEATALERAGARPEAAAAYTRLGATAIALRLRWESATDAAARAAVADAMIAQLRPGASTTAARDALILIERLPVPLTPAQQLLVARRAGHVGRAAQAANAFAAAARTSPLGASDRYAYGNALSVLGRWPEASVQYRGVHDPALTGHAAYFHARALLRGGKANEARNALERVVTEYPNDTVAAATALYLLGDLAVDAGSPTDAARWFERLAFRYPSSSLAPRAALLVGLVRYASGDAAAAATTLRQSAATHKSGTGGDAIRYWLARALATRGDSAAADSIFRVVVDRGPESYYATRAAARLDTLPWRADGPVQPSGDTLQPHFDRIAALELLGLDTEARFELDALSATGSDANLALTRGEALLARGYVARASQLGHRALGAGAARDARTLRLIYPLPWADALREAGTREGVDPLLAASVIRQESAFQPRATSRTDARGLMQVMPAVGKELGRAFGFADLDPALLWQPEVNIPLGMRHFGAALRRYPEPERALAAYNAGQSRVNRWSATLLSGPRGEAVTVPLDDVELFVERIPFDETRDYVRVVLRNAAMYRMLHDS